MPDDDPSNTRPAVPDRLYLGPPKPVSEMSAEEWDDWKRRVAAHLSVFLVGKAAEAVKAKTSAGAEATEDGDGVGKGRLPPPGRVDAAPGRAPAAKEARRLGRETLAARDLPTS